MVQPFFTFELREFVYMNKDELASFENCKNLLQEWCFMKIDPYMKYNIKEAFDKFLNKIGDNGTVRIQ